VIEFFAWTVLPWVILNSVCGLLGGMILGPSNRTGLGIMFGILLGPVGLIIVALICQWEQSRES
jgi:uncharacterized membrane protein YeaQ/YmgE (transglycosylase-associated protein family)